MVLVAATLILGPPPAGAATRPTAGSSPPGVGISLRPAHMDPAHPFSYFTLRSAAGTQLSDAVRVTNKSKVAVTVTVSAVDGLTGQTTGSVYANRGDPVAKAGAWVSLGRTVVHLAPKSSQTVSFTVSVPADAVAGDHLAGIAFQSPTAASKTGGFQIRQVVRSVMGVLVVVPGPARFHPKLTDLAIKQIGLTGVASIVVTLADNGLLLGKPLLRIALVGPNDYHRTLSRDLNTVLPGDSVHFPFPWPDRLVRGSYDITAWLTGGGVTVVLHRNYYLGKKLGGTAQPLTPASQPNNHWVWVAVAIGALLVVGLVMLFLIVARRRRKPRDGGSATDGESTPGGGGPSTPTDPVDEGARTQVHA